MSTPPNNRRDVEAVSVELGLIVALDMLHAWASSIAAIEPVTRSWALKWDFKATHDLWQASRGLRQLPPTKAIDFLSQIDVRLARVHELDRKAGLPDHRVPLSLSVWKGSPMPAPLSNASDIELGADDRENERLAIEKIARWTAALKQLVAAAELADDDDLDAKMAMIAAIERLAANPPRRALSLFAPPAELSDTPQTTAAGSNSVRRSGDRFA